MSYSTSASALVHGDLEGAVRLTFDGDDAEARASCALERSR
jgi:hypothetical protein